MARATKKSPKSKQRSPKPAAKPKSPPPSNPDPAAELRKQLAAFLETSEAHASWRDSFAEMPPNLRGAKFHGSPHTPWQLLEHLRIAQWDILEYSRDAKHVSPEFPLGYWPTTPAPPDDAAWDASVKSFRHDVDEIRKLLLDPKTDLFAKIPHGSGQTILREALLILDHNAYHLGQLVLLRRLLDAWPTQ